MTHSYLSHVQRVCGIDWASQPAGRAAVVLTTHDGGLRLERLVERISDPVAVQLCRDPGFTAVGVDTPFGWPVEFTHFVAGWRADGSGETVPPPTPAFRYRLTDRLVCERLKKNLLSVSSDLISLAARSWVALVQQAGLGPQIDCGVPGAAAARPTLIEVYPGATLTAVCGARPEVRLDGYKKNPHVRRALLRGLAAEFALDLCGHEEQVLGSGGRCDTFDAVVAALTTAIYAGLVPGWQICRPESEDPSTLCQEGWIYFPIPDPGS